MKIDVSVISPEVVEVTAHPSWWRRLLGETTSRARAYCWEGRWWWCRSPWTGPDRATAKIIERAVAFDGFLHRVLDRVETELRRAETARNYQAAARRGEYPIR